MKSNTQVELCRNFEKLKMIHKQKLRSLQLSGKPSAEIKIEIAFIMIKFEIHTLRLLYEILREKSLIPLENRILSNINLTLTECCARVVHRSVNANATNTLSRKE